MSNAILVDCWISFPKKKDGGAEGSPTEVRNWYVCTDAPAQLTSTIEIFHDICTPHFRQLDSYDKFTLHVWCPLEGFIHSLYVLYLFT